MSSLEALAVFYVALPNAIFLAGWIVAPVGPFCALGLVILVTWVVATEASTRDASASRTSGRILAISVVAAALWCLISGEGHFFYANSDWWVRDAVLLDLIRDPWPVIYRIDGVETLLRAPVGFYLPASLVGKAFGVRAADLAILAWTTLGVFIVFSFMLSDRPRLGVAAIRILIFVAFSGMDIIPTVARDFPHQVGAMIEWWARFLQYPSMTTMLFWAPNHAITGWVAVAWLLSRNLERASMRIALLFVVLMPVWAPLTALGMAPLVVALLVRRLMVDGPRPVFAAIFDLRVLVVSALCVVLIYSYLVSGSGELPMGLMSSIPWVGADYEWRYLEFVLVEFVGLALLLVKRRPRDLLLWAAVATLLALPIFRFGPYNDLVMRSSIPALALLAIGLGRWLSESFRTAPDQGDRVLAAVLLSIGAVTPLMEFSRAVIQPAWSMNTNASLIEITRGSHYLIPVGQPWLDMILAAPHRPPASAVDP